MTSAPPPSEREQTAPPLGGAEPTVPLPPAGYPLPGYQPPPYGYPWVVTPIYVVSPPPPNPVAIAALVCGVLSIIGLVSFCTFPAAIPAVICGHIGLSQIKHSNGTQRGAGMAHAGLIMGYLSLAIEIAAIVAYFVVVGAAYRDTVPG